MSNLGPYRDDREQLLAENRRLRRALATARRARIWPALASLAAYGIELVALRDWMHGNSEVRYWLAVLLLGGTLSVTVLFAVAHVLYIRRQGGNDDGPDGSAG